MDTALAGSQVFFGGVAAPILYTSDSQINAIVPYEISGQSQLTMHVTYRGISSSGTTLQVASAAPGIFTLNVTGFAQALAFNEDGSLNSPSNPAKAGSVISVYFTGGGETSPPGVTGSITGLTLKYLTQGVIAAVGGQPATISFAGAAPTFVDGVGQLNVRLSDQTPAGSAQPLSVGLLLP